MSRICEVFPIPALMQWAGPLLRCIHHVAESQMAVSEFTPSYLIRIELCYSNQGRDQSLVLLLAIVIVVQ